MVKTTGTQPMTPIEDHVARALSLSGKSYREIAELLGRSDKSIQRAVSRALLGEHPLLELTTKKELLEALSASDKKMLSNIRGFVHWLQDGEDNGYVAALVRLMGRGAA